MKPILVLAMLLASPCWASYLTISHNDLSRGTYVEQTRNGERFNSFAGVVIGVLDLTTPIHLLSADLYRTPPPGTYFSGPEALGTGWWGRAAWLYATQITGITTPELGAALQLAIWDVMADNGDGLSAGYLRASSTTPTGIANSWQHFLDISVGQSLLGPNFYKTSSMQTGAELGTMLGAILLPTPPDLIPGEDLTPGEDLGEVPEPSIISMFVVSMTLLVAVKRYL